MKANRKISGILITSLCLFLSCREDLLPGLTGGEEKEITFSMRVPGNTSGTRALSAGDEMEISDIFVLVFDPQHDTFLYLAPGKIGTATGSMRTFTVTLRSGTFDLVILANAGTWIARSYPAGIPPGTGRADILAGLTAELSAGEKWKATTGAFTPLPFWGEKNGVLIDAATDLATTPLSLRRAVAAIDVKIAQTAQADFTMESIYLYNSRTRGTLIPDPALFPLQQPTVAGDVATPPLCYDGTEITTAGTAFEKVIYTFEAEKGTTSAFRNNTCLVIGGQYKGTTCYYRVDFRWEEADGTLTYLPLLRNNRYTVTILQVGSAGLPTPDEAFNALPLSIQAEVTRWEEGYDEDLEIGGQNDFSISESYLVYPGVNDGEGTPFTGSIDVASSANWTYYLSTSPYFVEGDVSGWFTVTRAGNTKDDVISFSIEENMAGKRYAYIHFRSGNLTQVSTIFQRKHSDPNCYILKPGSTLEFPVRKAYTVWKDDVMGAQKQTLTGAITCGVIWQDVRNMVTVTLNGSGDQGDKTKLLVTANGTDEGNAVVGVYVRGTLRYSWHIWVTNYDPDTNQNGTTYLYNNGYQDYLFMDRNLGATTAIPGEVTTLGNYYQWGRKDPFPGPGSVNANTQKTIYGTQIVLTTSPGTTASTASNNVHNTLVNPFRYYYLASSPYDWFTTQDSNTYQNNYLWSDKDGDKGIFDPCPDGWRVPDWTRNASGVAEYSPWNGWTDGNFTWNATNRGRTYAGAFYPTTGYRDNGSGALLGVGTNGHYWAASLTGIRGDCLSFSSGNVNPVYNIYRARGLSVRCVQD